MVESVGRMSGPRRRLPPVRPPPLSVQTREEATPGLVTPRLRWRRGQASSQRCPPWLPPELCASSLGLSDVVQPPFSQTPWEPAL